MPGTRTMLHVWFDRGYQVTIHSNESKGKYLDFLIIYVYGLKTKNKLRFLVRL